jgi:hypothetical protein
VPEGEGGGGYEQRKGERGGELFLGARSKEFLDGGGGGAGGGDDARERLEIGKTELVDSVVTDGSATVILLVEQLVPELLVDRLLHELSERIAQGAVRRVVNVEDS